MPGSATQTEALTPEQASRWNRWAVLWMAVTLALFVILLLVGAALRVGQANLLEALVPERFYALLTLHGLGMVGAWYVGAMAGVTYLLTRYVRPSLGFQRFALAGTVSGVVALLVATLAGNFGTGWYFLHPLPFNSGGVWPEWAMGTFFLSLALLGVTWTVWTLDLLRAIAARYRLSTALAWPTLRGRRAGEEETPPFILVTTATLISGFAAFVAAVVVLVLFAAEWKVGGFAADSLLMKNLIFFFGHGLVNITMYLGVALLYEVLPKYTSRGIKTNKVVALAWNLAIFLVLMVYFHHLYMDFAQPRVLQFLGQIGSYLISIPAAVISIFSTLYLVYRAEVRWNLTSLFFFFGAMGWAIGGVQAVIDSTIAANFRFHNTLWVPSHFHTYYLLGLVMMVLAFAFHLGEELGGEKDRGEGSRWITALFLLGGYGFVLLLAVGGAHSVPRRYAAYPQEVAQGAAYASWSLVFVALLLVATLAVVWQAARRYRRALG